MNVVDMLFNAAGGGIVGSLLHLGTGIFETWRKKKDAEVEIMLMQAKTESAEKAAAWDAFARSQQSQAPFAVPTGVSPLMANIFTAVEAFKTFTRPGLTWALLSILVYVFSVSPEYARQQMLGEITFGAFTALFWWFGSRYSTKR
ncbi:hypothetical protein UFOVP1007_18 [uncultured Caudovirales phage]|uniref:Holin of 3TMs, for gene-transfer release n=1 Tax=uncultured Caudovirales phage TaxID=2100421 RepID=A0A6J5Q1Q6_9CAUD|nr:hypothetical protein UFOVP927_45 [uncultured Caudovirales phage]CAB4178059.1 hypothetical protein UFOVP1007_18 [uncultured Caudovirales phage]CAB4187324.1 hypothetical protein UFOVP1159_18 [uncultured Caudovirales phage]